MGKLYAGLCALLLALPLYAGQSEVSIDEILAMETPPPGVVLDVDEWDSDALRWAVPLMRDYVDRLRARFPDLEIAVVSHGDEEFALMSNAQGEYAAVQRGVEELVADKVPVHVCAGHAIMSGYSENGFVDFVEPVSSGVETVASYRLRGFVYILLRQPR